MNKTTAFLLIVFGFLASSFYASLHPTEMNWGPYVVSIGLAFVGLYFLKKIENADIKNPEVLEANRGHLKESLDNILKNITELNGNKENIPTYEMRFAIDEKFRTDIERFVEARESMKHIYNLQDYADIMSAFAAGERYLNRVWSASADGYIDEVMAYIEKAAVQFNDAKSILDKVSAKHA